MDVLLPEDYKQAKATKQELIDVLGKVKEAIDETVHVQEVLVMVNLDGEYVRFSTMLNDSMNMIATLELLKHDIVRRMKT